MSEGRLSGPIYCSKNLTDDRIRQNIINQGLTEIPKLDEILQFEIDSQQKAGEEYGFYESRVRWMKQLKLQQENGIAFHNPDCFRHGVCGDKCKCLIVWKDNNEYQEDRCSAAFYKSSVMDK